MNLTYVLVTPARNESLHLSQLIQSVRAQTLQPARWIIVDDNSVDKTYDIAVSASESYERLGVVRLTGETKRSFGSKAAAFKEGYKCLKDIAFDYIGNLDADVTFGPEYYERIMQEMISNPRLGVASGVIYDKTASGYKRTISSLNHAVGAVQFWRRACYEEIGGYRRVTLGGVDSLAERTARMLGWETRSFEELGVFHHKPLDTANGKTNYQIAYRAGATEYYIGTHPAIAVLKAVRRWSHKPIVLSCLIRIGAYVELWSKGEPRDASNELIEYLKREQLDLLMTRLQRVVKGRPSTRSSR